MKDLELVEAMARAIVHEIWGGEIDPRGKWKLAAQAALAVARPEIECKLLESMDEMTAAMASVDALLFREGKWNRPT